MEDKNYIEILKDRSKQSRVYRKYQLTGLLIAQLLNDEEHKSLYIKLAKNYNQQKLLAIAKDVSERKTVKNRGAYFMRLFQIIKNKIKKRGNVRQGTKSINNK